MSPALSSRDFACEKDSPTTFGTGGRDADAVVVVVVSRGGTDVVVEAGCDAVETNFLVVEVFGPPGVATGGAPMGVREGVTTRLGAGAGEVRRGRGLGLADALGNVPGVTDDTRG